MSTQSPTGSSPTDHESASAGSRGISRRGLVVGVAAATGIAIVAGAEPAAAAAGSAREGTAADAPNLPRGFTDVFKDQYVQANGIRQHIVVGGDGPPLLLVHGWPENWYAWRFMMPALAQQYTVIAVDQRGIGLTDKPAGGYDAGTLATDLAALMEALGYSKYAVVGHDTGYVISYALACDYRDQVAQVALLEIPGPPGVGDYPLGPPYFVSEADNNKLWHIAFNRVNDDLIVDMVKSNADKYYQYEFAVQGGGTTLPRETIRYYVSLYTRNRDTLRASFGLYRAWETTLNQNMARASIPLTIPVLGIGGENSYGPVPAAALEKAATDLHSAIISGVGHWLAEQAPDQMVQVLSDFFAPYRAE
ncbi:alpha/beta fold hydrolase [Agromyces humatus]|uniref:Alpha/beta hydrolase n=1 Tax=Agromyces humatus TaxID=279573 RepID=A0ABP4WTN9_9MICO|nr:alpha/beta hydrolase [Agromyces humatus]